MHYYRLGDIPEKRHTQFRKPDGGLYSEELFSTYGFDGVYSLLYHIHPPTEIVQVGEPYSVAPEITEDKQLKHRCLMGFEVAPQDDYLLARTPVLVNADCQLSLAAPRKSMETYFFKNADEDEVIFVHRGSGVLESIYGTLPYRPGDYVFIPRGTVYQWKVDTEDNKLFIVESRSPVHTPRRYRNEMGQLAEHSPYCERDIRKPNATNFRDEEGSFNLKIKKNNSIYPYTYLHHPFDVVGWDGALYPYCFSIHDFEPITGRVHQPPPVHQTFGSKGFVICSFAPRLYDYHPLSIPAPYNHSNIDSDEVLYYVDGDFMSRNNVEQGMITLHPGGIPHGPHPGTVEKSIGEKETLELAVMVDTFKPLYMTKAAYSIERPDYYKSWLTKH